MPRYDYVCTACDDEVELIHSIPDCAVEMYCGKCGGRLRRLINAPHVEGSNTYPFKLWNVKTQDGKFSVDIKDKAEHRAYLNKRDLDSPSITKWGKKRITA